MVSYYKLEDYDYIKEDFIDSKEDFETIETGYTKTIKIGDDKIIFNEDGKNDPVVLGLINMVRSDAKVYDLSSKEEQTSEIRYTNLIKKPPEGYDVLKIDINSAYWQQAKNIGLISKKTDDYLIKNYPDSKEMKKARLKALGSLATKKKITSYVKGAYADNSIKIEPTIEIYKSICADIDDLMMYISIFVKDAFFYYFDCIFTKKGSEEEVIKMIEESGFSCTTDECRVELVKLGDCNYIRTVEDNKVYAIRRENYVNC